MVSLQSDEYAYEDHGGLFFDRLGEWEDGYDDSLFYSVVVALRWDGWCESFRALLFHSPD
jgi:hypothetical protein